MTAVLPLVVFLIPLAYSPGPGNLFFAANGARFGARSTARANIGYHAATWIATVAIGLGFGTAIDKFPTVFDVLGVVGALYVLWLALKLYRSGTIEGPGAARPAGFVDGVILLILNPKAYVIIALMFTQFLSDAGANRWLAVLQISTIFTVNNLIAFTVWALIGDRLVKRFRSPASSRRINTTLSVALAAVAVWMLIG